jgi:biopolymer transport protein ExbD
VQVSEISGGGREEEELEDISLSVTATGTLHLDGVDLGDVKAQSVLERLKQEVGKSRAAGIRLTLDQNLSIAVYADLYQSFAGKRVTLVVDPGASDE